MKRPEGVSGTPQAAAPVKESVAGRSEKRAAKKAEATVKPEAAVSAGAAKADAAKRADADKKAALSRPLRPTRSRQRGQDAAQTVPSSQPAQTTRAPSTSRGLARARKRVEREEVKRFTRRARRRRTGWFLVILTALALAGLVVAAVFSPLLALRTITVDGTSRLSAPTLQKAVDGQLGTPLALLDYGKITQELAPYHLIRSYVTEVVPPDTLIIHVVERTPIGAIQSADAFDLVDPAGIVVDSSKTRPAGYPLIQLGNGRIDGPGYASMAQVLLALPPAVLAKVDTITAQTHDDVTLTLTGSSQRVVWGSSDDSDAKAQVLAALITLHNGSGSGVYDVSAPGTAVFHHD